MGVRCTKVTLTERLFRQSDGHRWAPLRQKVFLLIDDAPLIYPLDGQLNDGRAMPFRTLRCTTLKTPELDPNADDLPMNGQKVEANGAAFLFEFAGADDQGREIGFKLPQYFLPAEYVTTWSAHRTALRSQWQAEGARYQARLAGQKMRLVRGTSDNLDMAVEKMAFTADHGADGALFSPALRWAEARVPGVAEISGLADAPRRISLTPNFLNNSWPGDGRRIVVTIDKPIELDFGGGLTSDAMGAIGQANQIIGAIADELGPIPLPNPNQLDQMIRGDTDWKDVLPQFKVLGKFLLEELLGALSDHDVSLPTFRARREGEELIREWKLHEPITRSIDAAGVVLAPRDSAAEIFLHAFAKVTLQKLVVDGEFEGETSTLEIPDDLKDPAAEAHGHITNIDLTLFDLLKVRFDEIGFDAVAGRKPDGRVVMNADPMEFFGPLEFLNGLKDLIPSEGLGHGPMINPLPLGVEARFDMALPNVEIGVFALKNMTLGAKTLIPFTERPIELSFAFNERHRPFELAVGGFGGGGFFALSVDAGGVREIEAALEFGAQASMNIGVASGSVSIKGGVYFRYSSQDIVLEGYVELRGRLSVLELITASLVFHMALAYEKRRDIGRAYVRGEATLRIEVEVLFFSTSVTLHVERSFEAGEADPKFAAMTGARDWSTHCNAFA